MSAPCDRTVDTPTDWSRPESAGRIFWPSKSLGPSRLKRAFHIPAGSEQEHDPSQPAALQEAKEPGTVLRPIADIATRLDKLVILV